MGWDLLTQTAIVYDLHNFYAVQCVHRAEWGGHSFRIETVHQRMEETSQKYEARNLGGGGGTATATQEGFTLTGASNSRSDRFSVCYGLAVKLLKPLALR